MILRAQHGFAEVGEWKYVAVIWCHSNEATRYLPCEGGLNQLWWTNPGWTWWEDDKKMPRRARRPISDDPKWWPT